MYLEFFAVIFTLMKMTRVKDKPLDRLKYDEKIKFKERSCS